MVPAGTFRHSLAIVRVLIVEEGSHKVESSALKRDETEGNDKEDLVLPSGANLVNESEEKLIILWLFLG